MSEEGEIRMWLLWPLDGSLEHDATLTSLPVGVISGVKGIFATYQGNINNNYNNSKKRP